MPVIKINELDTYYDISGEGDTVILLHNGFSCSKMWKDIAPRLVTSGFRVLVFDRRGYGQSEGGIVYNVSRDGMFVVSVLKPGLYNHVNVVATGADGTPILFPGIVIHHNESGFGLLFQQLDGSARSFLQKCLC